ncbi:MAG: iron-sulfur cluster assembly accessory protein [Actinobacteria bacterium]|nr:iron-sulfur cluster assembly accessory protein [Actinomycetota bacterium]
MAESTTTTGRPPTLEEKKAAARERAQAARAAQEAGTAQVGLTDMAAAYVRRSADAEGKPHAMRLRVLAGGCSGLEYDLHLVEPDDTLAAHEREVLTNGIRLILDTKSAIHVTGSIIDYESDLLSRGFKIKNPNATSTCSCGSSFGV